jgi:hypothetical protein
MSRAWILIVLLSTIGGPAVAAQDMSLHISDGDLVISEATPGASVLWLGVARERPEWTTRVVRRHGLVVDDDGDGAVQATLGMPAAPHSVWLAVDLATGDWASWLPDGFSDRQVELPPDALVHSAEDGQARSMAIVGRSADVILVRPDVGAWWLRAADGGPGDGNRAIDGTIRPSFGQMQPIQGSPAAPEAVADGDLIIVIDPRGLGFSVTRLASSNS